MRKLLLAAIAMLALTVQAGAQDINVLTGGTSGIYYPLGTALTKIYGDNIRGVKASVQATKASVENLNLLQQGKGEVAFALGDALSLAWAGSEEAGFAAKLDKLRGLSALYNNYIQIVATAGSGITRLADLKGKRVSVGAPNSGTELNARAVLSAAGVAYDDLADVAHLPFAESVELIKSGELDATLQSAGLGVASIRDLAAAVDIVVVPIPADIVARIGDAAYIPATIPAGTYEGQEADVATAAITNVLVTRDDVSDDVAYEMTKLLFAHLDDLKAAHAAAGGISLGGALSSMPIPLHPGAEKYLREAGVLK